MPPDPMKPMRSVFMPPRLPAEGRAASRPPAWKHLEDAKVLAPRVGVLKYWLRSVLLLLLLALLFAMAGA